MPDTIPSSLNRSESITVFVVDDEYVIAKTLAMILKTQGFDAKPFYEPHEALEAARIESPALLITDVVMPGMSGIDLAIQVKQDCPNCKVLLFSGQAATNDLLETANKAGHNFQLLSKPVHPKDLLAAITQLEGTGKEGVFA